MRACGRQGGSQRGLTIVEMMVALAVAAILLGVGVPAFNGLVAQRTLTTQANDFLIAVQYARSEASRRGELISVRAQAAASGNEWGGGWCVVIGTDNACNATNDTVLRRFPAIGPNTLAGDGGLDGEPILTFNSRGVLTPALEGQLHLCNPNANRDPGRELRLSRVGRVSITEFECHP